MESSNQAGMDQDVDEELEEGSAPEESDRGEGSSSGSEAQDDDHEDDMDDEQDAIEQMEDLVEYVARHLVDDKDAVEVQSVAGDRATVFELTVAEDDLGKVIGRDGRTARALRTLLAASGAKLRQRAVLDILE